MRAAALSAPPASPATPASPAAPAASSGALTARSSGRALSGLQRGAACRTRGELDAQLGALCRAVLAPPPSASRRPALKDLPGSPRTSDIPGGGASASAASASARGCSSVLAFEAGLASRAAEAHGAMPGAAPPPAAACASCGGDGGVCSDGGGGGGGGGRAVGVGAEGRGGGRATGEEPLCFGGAADARRLPLFPLSLRLDAGCLGWLHCTAPTPADLRLFFVREEMAGDAAEMAGDAAEATAAAPQEAATTAAAAAAASSSAAVAAFVRRGGCRELAAAAQLHATRDAAEQLTVEASVEASAEAGRGGGYACTSAALTPATLSAATLAASILAMATVAGAYCISTRQRWSICWRWRSFAARSEMQSRPRAPHEAS